MFRNSIFSDIRHKNLCNIMLMGIIFIFKLQFKYVIQHYGP